MPRVCVMTIDGSVILDTEMEPLDVIQNLRLMCEDATGNLGCYLTADGGILDCKQNCTIAVFAVCAAAVAAVAAGFLPTC